MDLRRLRAFATVADERHFGRAALRLGVAQPPLSRLVQALEAELGVSLFDRSRRQIELTDAGRVLREHAERILSALEVARQDTQRAGRGESGVLRIGYVSSVAYSGIGELLRAYRARFPDVELHLREESPQAQVESLRARRIDVGFVRGPLRDPTLEAERVRDEALVVTMPSDHRLRRHRTLGLARLANEAFVMFPRERGPHFYDYIVGLCQAAGFEPRVVQHAPALDIVSLVAIGLGIAIVPETWRALHTRRLVFRPISGNPRAELLLAWPAGEPAPVVRSFVDVVRSVGLRRR
jgi:DNA-binding transcriptional LysR family regulator